MAAASAAADWSVVINNILYVHSPYLLLSTAIWTIIFLASSPISKHFSKSYQNLPRRLRMQWDNRIVALLHSVFILPFAFYGLFGDQVLGADHLHAFSSLGYFIMTTACGYFFWDTIMCLFHFQDFGLGFLLHGIGCLFTYLFSLDGVLMYYGCFYLTFEGSTPFLNFHWFMDKTNVADTNPIKKCNAVLLILTFFVFRIIFGIGYSYFVWKDIDIFVATSTNLAHIGIMYYFYFAILLLNGLNVFWFHSIVNFALKSSKKVEKERKKE